MLLLSAKLSAILFFLVLFFEVPVNHFSFQIFALISSFCTKKNFKFLHCLGLTDTLSANQNAEIFVCVCILLSVSDTLSDIRELSKYDDSGNDDARKQQSDWLNEEK